ncbi:MAG: hypothetical protein HY819_20510 [Acidobacteria bacterium]|nr:hypothetical protein [Acidobacteriota bacterium]
MLIELTRFKIKEGKSKRVDEWIRLLNDNMPAVLLTLEDEKMYVEAIFREFNKEGEFLYWFSIQGEGGKPISESMHEVDRKHIEYSIECIEKESKVDMRLEVAMLPNWIKDAINSH